VLAYNFFENFSHTHLVTLAAMPGRKDDFQLFAFFTHSAMEKFFF
jgi:hypothetical protein